MKTARIISRVKQFDGSITSNDYTMFIGDVYNLASDPIQLSAVLQDGTEEPYTLNKLQSSVTVLDENGDVEAQTVI